MSAQKRENGYYWVKLGKKWNWMVSLYADGLWRIPGFEFPEQDKAFLNINETRILSPSEIKNSEQ